jgi:hypothetical protein
LPKTYTLFTKRHILSDIRKEAKSLKGDEARKHVLSVRVSEADMAAIKRVAEISHESVQDTARKALEMIIKAYSGMIEK